MPCGSDLTVTAPPSLLLDAGGGLGQTESAFSGLAIINIFCRPVWGEGSKGQGCGCIEDAVVLRLCFLLAQLEEILKESFRP